MERSAPAACNLQRRARRSTCIARSESNRLAVAYKNRRELIGRAPMVSAREARQRINIVVRGHYSRLGCECRAKSRRLASVRKIRRLEKFVAMAERIREKRRRLATCSLVDVA